MEKGNAWFWIFAVIQGFVLYKLYTAIFDVYIFVIPEPNVFSAIGSFWALLFVVSTIGIEYLIFSKK